MNELAPLFLLLFAAAAAAAAFFWKKLSGVEADLKGERSSLDEQKKEAERARRELREKRDELEDAKRQLGEARNKLKKREKPEEAPRAIPGKKEKPAAEASSGPVAAIVRISDQQLEAQHRQALDRLEAELAEARAKIGELDARAARQRADAERAAQALSAAADRPAEAPAAPSEPAADSLEALRAQMDAIRKAAVDRERDMRRELRKTQEELGRAQRKASSSNQLYMVIKGQLDLAEDRLATLRKKYEGAKSIDELKREQSRSRRERRDSVRNGQAATAEAPADNPSTIGVAEEQIVSSSPERAEPPTPPPLSTLPEPAPAESPTPSEG